MFVVNEDNSIYATRGDIVFFSVSAQDDGKPYKFQAGDVVRIKVYGKKAAEEVVLQKDFPVYEVTEKVEIFLSEEDTKIGEVISKPKDYWYEVELNPGDNPQTVIGYDEDGAKVFKLFPEGDDIGEYNPDPDDFPVVDEKLDMTSPRPVANSAVAKAFANLEAGYEATHKAVAEKYVTPEMYGAVGDGVADDTESVQAAISGNRTVMLKGTYLVTDTIEINSGKSYGVGGKTVYGNGTLVIGANKDCLVVKGVGNNISGLTIQYHSSFYDSTTKTVSYDGALLSVVSTTSLLTNNNRFENVTLVTPHSDYNAPQHQKATGIKILCGTGAYVYNNIFTDCKCYGMDTAIKVVHEGSDLGVNANKFDVSVWCCDCYVDGHIEGCVISGNCQSRSSSANGCLFRNFTGTNNVVNSYFFDIRYASSSTRQAIIDEGDCGTSVGFNRFTAPVCGAAVLNYSATNAYNFTSEPLDFRVPWYIAGGRLSVQRMMPFGNALQQCTSAMAFDRGAGTVSCVSASYPTYDSGTKMLTDCYGLCSDTVLGREIYLYATDETTMTISFAVDSATRLDAIYLEHQNITDASCTIDGTPLTTVYTTRTVAFINETIVGGTEVVISFKVNSTKTGLLKRISAVGYDINRGSY